MKEFLTLDLRFAICDSPSAAGTRSGGGHDHDQFHGLLRGKAPVPNRKSQI